MLGCRSRFQPDQGPSVDSGRLSPCVPIASSRTAPPPASSATCCSAILAGGIRSPRSGGPRAPWNGCCGGTTAGGARCTPPCARAAPSRSAPLAARAVRPSPAASVALTAAATWAVVGGTSLGREARAIGRRAGGRGRRGGPGAAAASVRAGPAGPGRRRGSRGPSSSPSPRTPPTRWWARWCGGPWAGCRGCVGFRAVNTLDAMVGHRSPRYRRYGWASARLDDVAGWPGARLDRRARRRSAGPDPRGAVRAWRADARSIRAPTPGPWRPRSRGRSGYGWAGRCRTAGGSSIGRC